MIKSHSMEADQSWPELVAISKRQWPLSHFTGMETETCWNLEMLFSVREGPFLRLADLGNFGSRQAGELAGELEPAASHDRIGPAGSC